MEITQKTITVTKSSERMNRKSISEIVNIYNPLQIRDTVICNCSDREVKGMYVRIQIHHKDSHNG
jgi:hypothetical protein